MGIRDRLGNVGRNIVGAAGDALSGLATNEQFWKASEEDQEHTPGGAEEDSAETAPVPTQEATGDPKSLYWDPFSIIEQLGYKERPSNITYGTLKAITWKVPIIHSVINTRVNQVAQFTKPSQDRYDMGFKFHKRGKPKEELSPAESKWSEQMSMLMLRTGVTDNPRGRDSFETFTRKVIKDSLTLDQMCFEVVPNRLGQPAEWYAVDGASIRLADTASTYLAKQQEDVTKFVQIYDGQIITEYSESELCFGVRNPTSDMRLYGYGVSELEMLMNVVTSLLWAWEYNQRAFSQGSVHKGILNFKGAVPDKQLRNFRRHWYQMLSGVENAWRTPITNAEELQWIDMHQSSRDMEFNAWFDFLIKVACAMYSMDPQEVNFKYGNTGQKSAMNDSHNKDKLTESKERGLRPLLRYYADCLNRHIIWPINEDMEITFVGLDAMTKDAMSDLNAKRVKTTHTVNELRTEEGLEAIEGGDIILDPTFMQASQMNAMNQEGGDDSSGNGFDFGGDEDEEDDDLKSQLAAFEDKDEDKDEDKNPGGAPVKAQRGAQPAELQRSFQKSMRKRYIMDVEI